MLHHHAALRHSALKMGDMEDEDMDLLDLFSGETSPSSSNCHPRERKRAEVWEPTAAYSSSNNCYSRNKRQHSAARIQRYYCNHPSQPQKLDVSW